MKVIGKAILCVMLLGFAVGCANQSKLTTNNCAKQPETANINTSEKKSKVDITKIDEFNENVDFDTLDNLTEVPIIIHFKNGSAEISPQQARMLSKFADKLKPEANRYLVKITGRGDLNNSSRANLDLGDRRADLVEYFLGNYLGYTIWNHNSYGNAYADSSSVNKVSISLISGRNTNEVLSETLLSNEHHIYQACKYRSRCRFVISSKFY